MNNLFGTVMSFNYLPYEGFRFLSEEEINGFDLDCISENSFIGYILEVDLNILKNYMIAIMIILYVLKRLK